ncbi:hypothetical protein [Maritimibacter sp. UBA3975]|uniref:tetratricopeptide repeat protein n=1 Tax=Maritimibacter sp. UBA3975 TaxID=1946833 RepID=UPI000C0B8931|nr:hypothetical protein [Maritimibacter sp. UBA3975]MAM60930.1 hypothetical protein [Maritimibacter sp.]|tara:strand:- start:3813 stop:5147 length:1335 start_codon:yes stop_codon:yes gene_type:complete
MSVVALCAALGTPALAQAPDRSTVLPAAAEALAAGDAPRALGLTNAVIAANPRDIDALLLKSQILFAMGQSRSAREASQAAFNASDIPAARYAAAVRTADIIAQDGNYVLSQFWLRRALPYVQTDAEMERLVQAYRFVKQKNPWRFSFSGGASPNSNINNGSSESIIYIYGLPFVLSPTARALSGFTAEAQGKLEYRLFESQRSQTTIGVEGAGRMNWLDAKSRAAAPTVSGHDYDFYSLAVIATHKQIVGNGIRLEFSGRAGRNWYGGTKLSDFFGAGAAVTFPIAQGRDALTFTGRADRSLLVQGGLVPETTLSAGASYGHKLAWGDTVRASLNYTRSFSSGAAQVYSLPSVGLEYQFNRPILGAHLEIGGNYGYKTYNFSPFSTTGRQDRILSGRVSADFRGLSYMGFSPVVTVEAKRVWSNVPIYSQQTLSGGISFESRF